MVGVVFHLVAVPGEVLLVPHLKAIPFDFIKTLWGNSDCTYTYLFLQDDVHSVVLVFQVAESAEQRLPLFRLVVAEPLRVFKLQARSASKLFHSLW